MVSANTRGVRCTRALCTHRHTLLAQYLAFVVVPTVGVNVTFNANARHQRVALQARRADAARLVVFDATFSAAAARLGSGRAWVDAVLLLAGFVERTIIINTTFS